MNEETPCWDEYHLSKSRMQSIQDDSVKFRITCKYDTDGVVYTDYLQAAKKQIDILTYQIEYSYQWRCKFVDYINVGEQNCSKCTAAIRQSRNTVLHFNAIGSYYTTRACSFRARSGARCYNRGDISFGWYYCYNPKNRCASSQLATTQTWLGDN